LTSRISPISTREQSGRSYYQKGSFWINDVFYKFDKEKEWQRKKQQRRSQPKRK
jgi:hypothetical protein